MSPDRTRTVSWVWATLGVVLINTFSSVTTQTLSRVTKIALDKTRPLEANITVKAVYGTFETLNPVWVQLWEPMFEEPNSFKIVWQKKLQPLYGNGSSEIINLDEDDFIELRDNYRMGMINDDNPGPVEGVYKFGNGVVLSIKDREEIAIPLKQGIDYEFDDLLLPYHIPLFFCNVSGCPSFEVVPPTIPPRAVIPRPSRPYTKSTSVVGEQTEAEEFLQSVEMIIGLLVWNIALTLFVFGIILVLICVCADIEKLKRRYRRQRGYSQYPNGTSYHQSVDVGGTMASRGSSGTRDGWKTAGSWNTPSMPKHSSRDPLTEDEFNA